MQYTKIVCYITHDERRKIFTKAPHLSKEEKKPNFAHSVCKSAHPGSHTQPNWPEEGLAVRQSTE